MLTIRHKTSLGELLVEADYVKLIEPSGDSGSEDVATLHVRKLDGGYELLTSGVVYVMNSEGATVAVYHLAGAD